MFMNSKITLISFLFLLFSGAFFSAHAQSMLDIPISVQADKKPLGNILGLMEQKGNFRFAYYSKLVAKDSLVSIHADQSTIKDVLDQLLKNRYEYKESKGFIILRYAPLELALVLEKNSVVGDYQVVNGYIMDVQTNKRIENASVYEKNALQSTLTDKEGFFELKLKNIPETIELTVVKENYKTITTIFLSEIKIQMGSRKSANSDYVDGDFSAVERSGIGRFFISSKQKIQSLNLGGLISEVPVQASLIPSLSTRGMMNSQINSSVSLNLLGGYTGGVRGVEMAGLYNINRMNVHALQMAGIFNTVGGSVKGVQLAGVYNNVFGDLNGLQMSGIHNSIKGSQIGLQISGIYNHTQQDSKGIQIAAIYNNVNGSQNGLQISGIYNAGHQKVRGMQIAALNYAKELDGLQIGLINFAGSPSGYSFGLLNFKKDGYQKFSVTRNEISDINLAIKTGDNKLYTILMAGKSERTNEEKLASFGFGLGKNAPLGNRLSYNPEISIQYLYLGNWDRYNFVYKFDSPFTFRIFKGVALSAGPSFNLYSSERRDKSSPDINNSTFVQNRTKRYNVIKDNGNGITGWVGWSFGLTLF